MRIGPYELLGEIGRGGMGVVHRARSPEGADVALKLLTRTANPDAAARFERERRLLASLGEAQGFVALLDAGTTPQGPYLVMPFVTGGTLRGRLNKGPFEIADALALGRTLAAAIGRAHSLGIVHRDLKPENVLFTGDGRALVADLGVAKHFTSDAPGASQSVALSRPGNLLGTAGYMPYEQMSDASSVGPPADVFALGAILHECLAGEPAFPGDTPLEVFTKVDRGETASLRSLRKETPPWLEAVVQRALDREPGRRFADGAALGRALEAGAATGGRRPLAILALVGALAAVSIAFALRPPAAKPTVESQPRIPPPPAPDVDLGSRLRHWPGRIPADELARALHDFPHSGEELAVEALAHGISGSELSPEVRQAFRTRGALAHAVRAVEAVNLALASADGQERLREVVVSDPVAPKRSPAADPLPAAWRTLFVEDDRLRSTFPALVAPIFSSLEAFAIAEVAARHLSDKPDVTGSLVGLNKALLARLDPSELPPALRGVLAYTTGSFLVRDDGKVAALLAGSLELERRNNTTLAAILLCCAVRTSSSSGGHPPPGLPAMAAKAHRLALLGAEREPDETRRRELFETASRTLLSGWQYTPASPAKLDDLRGAFSLAAREHLVGVETLAAQMMIDDLIESNQCARINELLPDERPEWLPELLCARARADQDAGFPERAAASLQRARALPKERTRRAELDRMIEETARYLERKR